MKPALILAANETSIEADEEIEFLTSKLANCDKEIEKLRGAGRILPEGFRCCMSSDEKTLHLFHDNPTHRVKSSVTNWFAPSENGDPPEQEIVDWTKNKKCREAVLSAFGEMSRKGGC